VKIGPYEVLEKVGQGGAGAVFRARGPNGREVAVKVLKEGRANERFEREVRLLGSLGEEEGFVPLLGSGAGPEGRWLAMPFFDGGTLRDRIMKGPMKVAEALELGVFLARTLSRAHERGIVHRDLKPENILYTKDGKPLVADLGLAKHWSRDADGASQSISLTRAGEMRGTPGYMAPEQMKDSKEATPEADVFAIGAILYECLAGVPAFTGTNIWTVLEKVESGTFESLRKARADVPAWLADGIESALEIDPGKRPRDGHELLLVLTGERSRRGRPGIAIAASLVLVLVLVLVLGRSGPSAGTGTSTEPPVPVIAVTSDTGLPKWYQAIPARERFGLPRGVVPSEKPGEYRNEKDGTTLLLVAAGPCTVRGSDEDVHKVVLGAFLVSKYELTFKQFRRFVEDTHYVTGAEQKGGGLIFKPGDTDQEDFLSGYEQSEGTSWRHPEVGATPLDDEPVTQVTYLDARAYCAWAGLDLPTEEEWEKAASWDGKRARPFPWGDRPPSAADPRRANIGDLSFLRAIRFPPHGMDFEDGYPGRAPVGSFEGDRSPCGALDMGGNVAEWCTMKDPRSEAQRYRGGHFCAAPKDTLVTTRDLITLAATATNWVGFRPIRRLDR